MRQRVQEQRGEGHLHHESEHHPAVVALHRADALQQVAQRDVRGRRSDAGDDRVRHDRDHVLKSIEMRV